MDAKNIKRLEIFPYFEGVNTLVASNLSKNYELAHCENARATLIGPIEKRQGTRRLGDSITATANSGIFYFVNSTATNTGFYRISTVSGTTSVYYLNTDPAWTALSGVGTSRSEAQSSTTIAEGCCFIVDGTNNNCYITSDGLTAVDSTTSSGHLYNSPKAEKINYYKDRLYLADYVVGSTEYKNSIMMSSVPLGILALVDGDHAASSTTIAITDTKYIRTSDSLDIYRGGTLIETLTVTGKTEDSITVTATTNALNSSDEVWVAGTYTGSRVFRWADNPKTGSNVKEYDTFKVSGGQNDEIKMMTNIGDVMAIANKHNMAVWNNYNLKYFDVNVGCVSDNGYVKALGTLWFVHYTGIYATSGDRPKLMSAKVEKYITGATKAGLEAAAAGTKGMSVFFAIGAVTLYHADGSVKQSLSDVVLEYNMRTENWYVHTGIKATQFSTYIGDTDADRLQFTSSESGYPVFEFLNDTVDDVVTSNKEILFRIDTNNITPATFFEKMVYPLEIIIEVERGSGVQTFISLDNDSFYEIRGTAHKGCTVLKVNNREESRAEPPRCRQLKLSIRDYSKQLCKISRIALIYAETTEEEELYPENKD